MKSPHFYKAQSRLGLINIPYKQTGLNIGVEDGPDAILVNFNFALNAPVNTFKFSLPETTKKENYFSLIAKETEKFASLIHKTLKPHETQVVIGGDHSVVLASLVALFKRVNPELVGYIQIDSHADLHLVRTSPSGNFHGMWLRPVVDIFDNEKINALIPRKLPTDNLIYIGNLDLEPEEISFIENHSIQKITKVELPQIANYLVKFFKKFSHLHISIDIDAFDQTIAPATGIPSLNGLFWEDIASVIDVVKLHPSISIDLVEVNPQKKKAGKTITLAQRILKTILS